MLTCLLTQFLTVVFVNFKVSILVFMLVHAIVHLACWHDGGMVTNVGNWGVSSSYVIRSTVAVE